MPTYEYACRSCGSQLEVVQSFTDDALTTCGECGGPLRKVFGAVGISFKGSGFYKTDSRKSTKSTSSSAASSSEAGATGSTPKEGAGTTSSGSTDGGSGSTPAPSAPATPAPSSTT
jgi:putative FmdB family regulatory protein